MNAGADWNTRCADWKTRYGVVTDEHRKPEGLVSIFNLAEVIGTESRPEDKLVSGSSGSGIEIFLLACPTRSGQRIFHTAGLGSMGYGLPMSVAVAIGSGRQETILVDGDGGFQFNIQELETVRRLNLPVKLFVLNNDGYASIRASQKGLLRLRPDRGRRGHRAHGPQSEQDRELLRDSGGGDPRSDQPARRGAEGARDGRPRRHRCARHSGRGTRAALAESYQKPDGSFVSRPLEDMFPFLPREEFLANMIVKPLEE